MERVSKRLQLTRRRDGGPVPSGSISMGLSPTARLKNWGRTGASHLVLVGLVSALAAAPAAQATPAGPSAHDHGITCRARQALARDAGLADLPVGVSVRAGIATIWGSVPSKGTAERVVAVVRDVQGVLEVRNELSVQGSDDPLTDFLSQPMRPQTELVARPPVPALLSGPALLTSRWADWEKMHELPLPFARSSEDGPRVALMPPVLLPSVVAEAKVDLAQTVEGLRQGDARFRGLVVDVTGGIVRIGGLVQRREDAMELAQAIARVPGVERVILQDVRTPADSR